MRRRPSLVETKRKPKPGRRWKRNSNTVIAIEMAWFLERHGLGELMEEEEGTEEALDRVFSSC